MPETGATGFGYKVAEQFGLNLVSSQPGLVPLTLSRTDLNNFGDLSGISVDAVVSCNGKSFRESILFTHRGLSGPAILQISNYWQPGSEVVIDLLPDLDLVQNHKSNGRLKGQKQS